MPHLQSVLRNCFLLSIGTWGGGEGRGERETHMFQYSICSHPELNPVWTKLEFSIINIRKMVCTSQYKGNGLSMPYLQILLWFWLAISVCRAHICLTSYPLWNVKKRRAMLLHFICSSNISSFLLKPFF